MAVYYFDGNHFEGLYVATSKMNAIMLTSSEIQKLGIYCHQTQNFVEVTQGFISAQMEVLIDEASRFTLKCIGLYWNIGGMWLYIVSQH